MKFNLICIQSHNERPSKLDIDKKLKLIQSEFEDTQHHMYDTNTSYLIWVYASHRKITSQFKAIGLLARTEFCKNVATVT